MSLLNSPTLESLLIIEFTKSMHDVWTTVVEVLENDGFEDNFDGLVTKTM